MEASLRFNYRLEDRAGQIRRIEYEQQNGIWADKPGSQSSSNKIYMVEQLSKADTEKLFAQSSASSSGKLDMPKAGQPRVLHPIHPLENSMDWTVKAKRTGEENDEEQIHK